MSLVEASPEAPRISLTELDNGGSEVEHDHQHCLVCYSDLTHPAILPCNHNEICGVCHLRLRHLHGNKRCPICKEEHEKIIADHSNKTFDDYPMWGDDMGSNYVYQKNVGMFFPTDYYNSEIEPLFGYQCIEQNCPYDGTVPDASVEDIQDEFDAQNEDGNNQNNNKKKKNKKPPSPLRALQDHLRTTHRLTLCQLCIDHKRDFVALLPRMAPYQLKKHLTKGDGPGSGFEGHPVCEFCRPKRFYDLTHLHMHLQKEHYKCHVCEKQGLANQYFRNYQSLEKHFDRSHFLCRDVQCLQARFVVFENEIDLHAHERQVHGGTTSGSSKIQLEFRTRRTGHDGSGLEQQRQEVPSEEDFNFGLQGEAFVPAAMPQSNDLTLHPLHLRRTAELRAQAAEIREQQEIQNRGAAFPTLQAATAGGETQAGAGQQPLNIGWASGTTVKRVAGPKKNAGQVTEDDFPALPTSGPKSAATAKVRAGTPAGRQIAAIRATAAQPIASAGGNWGGIASRQAAAVAPSYDYNMLQTAQSVVANTNRQENLAADNFPALGGGKSLAHINRQENLAPDNFPALGGGKKKAPQYFATSKLTAVKQPRQQQPPSWNSTIDFPDPSGPAKNPAGGIALQAPAKKQPPSINSQMDFPPPPRASTNIKAMKQELVKNQKQPSQAAMANVLKAPLTSVLAPADPKSTLQDLQASLGPAKYKKLKKCTREFANDDMDPDAFIDHAAALFDKGHTDPDFWKTIPALVSSCPNQSTANEALRYMESLRAKKSPPEAAAMVGAPSAPLVKSWGSTPLDLKADDFPTPAVASARPGAAPGRNTAVAGLGATGTRYVVPTGNKKNVWGGSTPATSVASVVQPKKVAGSVSSAAANEGPQGGSATKFMAKQNKQQAQHQQKANQNPQGKKNIKKKQKDELRNLAFGR